MATELEDSLARLSERQLDKIRRQEALIGELLRAVELVEFRLRSSVTVNLNTARDAMWEVLAAAMRKAKEGFYEDKAAD